MMEDIEDLDVSITDASYQEGLQEIINNLKTIKINTDTMSGDSKFFGEKEMLNRIINYLERCL